jgi:hypothetical protein
MSDELPTNIPSYRRHKPSGLAVVRLNGRDLYLGKHGTAASRAEYRRVIVEWLACGRQISDETLPTTARAESPSGQNKPGTEGKTQHSQPEKESGVVQADQADPTASA